MPPRPVLLVDDQNAQLELYAEILTDGGYDVLQCNNRNSAIEVLSSRTDFVLILTDNNLGAKDPNGGEAIFEYVRDNPKLSRIPFILMTRYGKEPGYEHTADAITESNALIRDYIDKDITTPEELLARIKRCIENAERRRVKPPNYDIDDDCTVSPSFQASLNDSNTGEIENVIRGIGSKIDLDKLGFLGDFAYLSSYQRINDTLVKAYRDVQPKDYPVWIHGESGTGKELLARALHFDHPSRDTRREKFGIIQCTYYGTEGQEREFRGILCGAYKGFWTGLNHPIPSIYKTVDGGSLYFEEIGKIGISALKTLLGHLNSTPIIEFRDTSIPTGRYITANVRIITASEENLLDLAGWDRNIVSRIVHGRIDLPTLKQRIPELPYLASYVIFREKGNRKKYITEGALKRLLEYEYSDKIFPNFRGLVKIIRNIPDGNDNIVRSIDIAASLSSVNLQLYPEDHLADDRVIEISFNVNKNMPLNLTDLCSELLYYYKQVCNRVYSFHDEHDPCYSQTLRNLRRSENNNRLLVMIKESTKEFLCKYARIVAGFADKHSRLYTGFVEYCSSSQELMIKEFQNVPVFLRDLFRELSVKGGVFTKYRRICAETAECKYFASKFSMDYQRVLNSSLFMPLGFSEPECYRISGVDKNDVHRRINPQLIKQFPISSIHWF